MTEIKDVKLASRALTTNEILENYAVEVLKKNKKEGRAFAFLPFEAREWAKKNPQELLVYSRKMGNNNYIWIRRGQCDYPLYEDTIYALPDDYELQMANNKNGEWIEFDIDDKGFFQLKDEDKKLKDSKDSNNEVFYGGYGEEFNQFHWSDWGYFLTRCADLGVNYTAFGGWQYENNSDSWNTFPMIKCGERASSGVSFSMDDKPMIPKKIRFWRENAKKNAKN